MDLADKAVMITGGASGLGAATARGVVAEGGRVVLMDLNEVTGHTLAKELGASAIFVKGDVTEEADVANVVAQGRERFGALHGLVCCAGIGPPARVLGREGVAPLDWFTRIININLVGTFNALRLAVEAMAENEPNAGGERGAVVMTASVAAYEGQIGQSAYAASKGGIVAMTLPIARELASLGIRVMTLAPGLFDTPLLAGLPEEAKESLGHQVPFPPRLGKPEEYAEAVLNVFHSPMLNGSVIRLDGAIRMAPR